MSWATARTVVDRARAAATAATRNGFVTSCIFSEVRACEGRRDSFARYLLHYGGSAYNIVNRV